MPKLGTAEYSKTNKFIYYIVIGWNNALRGKSHGKKIGGPKLGRLFNNIRNNLQMFYQLHMFSQKVSPPNVLSTSYVQPKCFTNVRNFLSSQMSFKSRSLTLSFLTFQFKMAQKFLLDARR